MTPFLKWPGSKRWLATRLVAEMATQRFARYVDPFLGAGAIPLTFPKGTKMLLGDKSEALMNLWRIVTKHPELLGEHAQRVFDTYRNCREGYNEARAEFNEHDKFGIRPAALMLYLNRVCYNGLWRENKRGQMNTPFGKFKAPRMPLGSELREGAEHVHGASFATGDFEAVLGQAGAGDLVYLDPPYDAGYTAYTKGGFSSEDQRRLGACAKLAAERGAKIWATNADTPFIREIYGAWATLEQIEEPRMIAANASRRQPAACLLIRCLNGVGHEGAI